MMKKYLRTYLISTLCSIIISVIPWALALFNILSKLDVLECYAIGFAFCSLIATWVWLCKMVKAIGPRITMVLLNPVLYYFIGLIVVASMFLIEASK